ncbi:MAG TPA: hypothetical protein VGG04_19550 [Candidatus Sulfotelmatobacter sp.]|jgi:metal-responsive CopG/Arc/MetJ family transcriptional regulator
MKRVTITLPDELAAAVDEYLGAQDGRITFTALAQEALREFLGKRGFLKSPNSTKSHSTKKTRRKPD